MAEYKFDKETILEKTNRGLEVIRLLYPDCEKAGRFVHFKQREEDTASAIVYLDKQSNTYKVKDFGDSKKPLNAIDLVMDKEVLEFYDACKWIADQFQLEGSTPLSKPSLEIIEAEEGQEDGQYIFNYKPFTKEELKVLGKMVTAEICEKYNFKSCESFIQVKQYKDHEKYGNKLMQIITRSNETYPIFVIDEGQWQKVYQPLNKDKQYRFRYVGEKPKNHVFGLTQIDEYFDGEEPRIYEDSEGEEVDERLDRIIIAGGDRDSINVAALGDCVVWKNSESAQFEYSTYEWLRKRAKALYYIGDIDQTGVREAVAMAKQYIDIKIVWLPDELKDFKYRGKPKKDFKDYVDHYCKKGKEDKFKTKYENLLWQAVPLKFWISKKDKKKRFIGYDLNNIALRKFLQYFGFFRFEEETSKEPFTFVRVDKGIVERKLMHHVSNFPLDYLVKNQHPVPLQNFVYNTSQLGEKHLKQLELIDLNFKDCSYDHQLFFFRNAVWRVTKDGITDHKYGDIEGVHVWKDKILQHDVKINNKPVFKVTKKENGKRDIEILRTDNHFFNYLINTSRVHWKVLGHKPFENKIRQIEENDDLSKEEKAEKISIILEKQEAYRVKNRFNIAEEGLSEDLIQEQKDHLINKLFALGYLFHKQKVADRPWCVFAMDDMKGKEITESNGGTGKSIVFEKAVRHVLLNNQYKAGRDPELFKNKHLYEGTTADTDYALFDDLNSFFPFQRVFSEITGDLAVNPKHGKQYVLPFDQSPKFAMTSNYPLYDADDSTRRRLLYTMFSDYYHYKNKHFRSEHKPTTDIGKVLFSQFDKKEWSDYFNLVAEMLQFYLGEDEKIDCPMEGVDKAQAERKAGGDFVEWADRYFSDENNLDTLIERKILFEACKEDKIKVNQKTFKQRFENWCISRDYVFNPMRFRDKEGKRIRSSQNGMNGAECFYIETPEGALKNKGKTTPPPPKVEPDEDTDDLPF